MPLCINYEKRRAARDQLAARLFEMLRTAQIVPLTHVEDLVSDIIDQAKEEMGEDRAQHESDMRYP